MNIRGVMAAVLLVALVATGCARRWDTSDIDNPTTTQAVRYTRDIKGVVASITDLLSTQGPDQSHWAPDRSDASCVADRLVRRFTAEGLLDRGFDPNQATLALTYSPEDRVAAINVLVGCIDFSEGVVALLSSYDKLPKDEATCMARGVKRLGLDRDFAGGIVDRSEPDPFANGNRLGSGLGVLAAECLGIESLITAIDPPRLPAPPAAAPSVSSTTTTSTTAPGNTDDLVGIVPGGPLDPGATSER